MPFARIVALLIVVSAVTLLASPSPGVHASWPGRNGAIAFATDEGIATMSPDGLNRVQLTDQPNDINPKWSPDGRMIAFQRVAEIWVMNGDGSNQSMIAEGTNPTWTPDFNLLITRDADILKIDSDGQTLANLTNTQNVSEYGAAASPDGTLIAFSSNEDPNGDPNNPAPGLTPNMWLIDSNGQNKRLRWQQDNGTFEGQMDWAPDNSRIAFVDDGDVWTIPPDGNNPTNLTENDDPRQQFPAWSPDGRSIAYSQDTGNMTPNIFLIDVDTRSRQDISLTSSGYDDMPHWQPWAVQNGRIWFITDFGFDQGFGIANSDPDGSHRRITEFLDIQDFSPAITALAWSPDGTKLAIGARNDSVQPPLQATLVVNTTGELVGGAQAEFAAWLPDSRRVVATRDGDLWLYDTQNLQGSPVLLTATANNVTETDSAVSPDGRWVAFSSNESPGGDPQNPTAGNNFDLYLMDIDIGTDRMPIVQSATYTGFPSWSPDGRRVAYGDNGDIWTVDPFNPIDRVNVTNDSLYQSDPAYSPDGKRIAFTQRSGLATSDRQVWTIDVQTKQRTRVTSDPIVTEEARPDWHPVFAPGSDRYVVWGDNACLGKQSLLGVLATLKHLAGIQNQGRPGCPFLGESGLTSTNITTEWGNLDCASGVDTGDVIAGILYILELELPQVPQAAGDDPAPRCPEMDEYIEWVPLGAP